MKIGFHGAARNVTGSKHLISLNNGFNILLDCGMFQGLGSDTHHLNNNFGFDPKDIDVLLLSHAHIDHSGLIPKLVKEGFSGKIYCTEATRELTEILLYDSAEIQAHDFDFMKNKYGDEIDHEKIFYTSEDVQKAMSHFHIVSYNEWINVSKDIKINFTNAGHLVGSAAINLIIKEKNKEYRILYSGDIGRYRSVLLQPPAPCFPADYIILESTYGDKYHDVGFKTIEFLQKWIIDTCINKKGKLVIPAFSVGRTQEVLYALNQLSLEKRLPELLYFIDSPLSTKATETLKKYPSLFSDRLQEVLKIDNDPFDFPGLKYIESVEHSRKLMELNEPCVIISASGTGDAGRVKHHINNCIKDPNSSILLVGYCGPKSIGGQLVNGKGEIEIFGETCEVAATVGQLHGMSAHGDFDDLVRYLSFQDVEKVKSIFLVHGEQKVQEHFAMKLETKGFKNIQIPLPHQEIELGRVRFKRKAA